MQTPDEATLAYLGLTPDDILAAIESVGPRCDGRFLALNSYENRVYRIGIEDEQPLVAKFYRPQRWTDEAILEEHDFSFELAAADVPVVTPLVCDGMTLHRHGAFRFALYPYRGGRTPELDDMSLLRQIGRLVARMHRVGETRSFVARPTLDVDAYGYQSRAFLLDNDFIPEDIEPAYSSTCDLLFEAMAGCFDRAGDVHELRLHADFHPSNVLTDRDIVHIVDLDDARRGPAVQDLWMFLSGEQHEQTPQLAELLEGYSEFRVFDPRELHLIEALRTLRIMHYAAWIARRWMDPAFKHAFPWFDTRRYWDEHVLTLREQVALMNEQPLDWRPPGNNDGW